jgi:hypothetical protein
MDDRSLVGHSGSSSDDSPRRLQNWQAVYSCSEVLLL